MTVCGLCGMADDPGLGDDGLTVLAEGLQSNANLIYVRIHGASM